ncbi:MAG TPA: hypothetical protein VM866_00070 [Pyrinomonadaceae bacterium]|jgi:hypothetical protein|nr:hypothetical protein [Pyrinomonadaceae bacterium]
MNKETIRRHGLLTAGCVLLLLTTMTVLTRAQTPAKPQPDAKPQPAAKSQPVEGTYEGELVADGVATLPFTLIVKKDGEKLTTEVKDGGDLNITGITLNGEDVTLAATHQDRPFELPGKLNETGMGGKWEAGGYSGTWSAKRRADK